MRVECGEGGSYVGCEGEEWVCDEKCEGEGVESKEGCGWEVAFVWV